MPLINNRFKSFFFISAVSLLIAISLVNFFSYTSYKKGQQSLKSQKYTAAINYFGESIRWYHPLNPWCEKSLNNMLSMAQQFEEKGLYKAKSQVFLELRSALSSVRGIYFPFFKIATQSTESYLKQIESDFKMLPIGTVRLGSFKDKYILEHDGKKRFFLSLVFIVWLLSIGAWIFQSFNHDGQLYRRKRTYAWGVTNMILMGLWLCMLISA